jgi:restriction system protein
MARRDESILDLLTLVPWWVSVLVSITVFVTLRYIFPRVEFGSGISASVLKGFVSGLQNLAPVIALVLLIPAPIAAYNAWRKRKLLDTQASIDSIRSLDWKAFEELVGEAYRRQGYAASENPGTGPDGGIDLLLRKGGQLTVVQCKQWRAQKVGVEKVRELYGLQVSHNAAKSILITSGFFTQEAKNFAADKPIDLVEGSQLLALIQDVRATTKRTTPQPTPSVACPECGSEMVLRTAQKGPHPGRQFWGCSTFPKCRATKPYQGMGRSQG